MNQRPGIDTHPVDFMLLVKLNLDLKATRGNASDVLKTIENIARIKMDPLRTHGALRLADDTVEPRLVVDDYGLNLLVGFGLRFFLGPQSARQHAGEEVVQNFPPGGLFKTRPIARFGISNRNVPLYLRTMNAEGDKEWLKRVYTSEKGKAPTDGELDQLYADWQERSESDLLLVFEAKNRFLTVDFWDAVREALAALNVTVVSIQDAFTRGDGRDHTGFIDGSSNLKTKMETDPLYYRSKVYLPHPAPAYPGEPEYARDCRQYDGGTYLVHRKYEENLALWKTDKFSVKDQDGKVFTGEEARRHAIGRDRETGKVISRMTGKLLDQEPDSAEVNLGYNESHVLKARGGTTAPFMGPFPPLAPGQTNMFNTQDIRIRRRGMHFCEIDPKSGAVRYGLHFICFQNNIQQTGFEFINNVWLLNPLFRRSKDGLFDPENGVIRPLEGCYYFVPPEHRNYPGEVFFD